MNYSFIILNYNTAGETVDLIDSVSKVKRPADRIRFTIIDNASPDNSYQVLSEKYSADDCVEVFRMPDNIGFSRANNYGYKKVLQQGDADFCIVTNSDVLIEQADFFEKIESEYKRSNFGILGPDINCKYESDRKSYGHQSPFFPFEYSKGYLLNQYRKNALIVEKQAGIFRLTYPVKKVLYWGIKCRYWTFALRKYKDYYKQRHEDVPVHGSFIVLSKQFMSSEKQLFTPETMFYGEELLLYFKAVRKGIKIVYNPGIYIKHLQGVSVKNSNKQKDREFFIRNNLMNSNLLVLHEMIREKE